MSQARPAKTIVRIVGLLAGLALIFAVVGVLRSSAPPAAVVAPAKPAAPAPVAGPSKQEAMAALMALPELKAWASRIESDSGGKLHAALMETDSRPKIVAGKSYWQVSFVENGADAARTWDSFLVGVDQGDILIEDFETDQQLSLEQWRAQRQPMARTSAQAGGR
ncbi:MAG: hypothetical protein V4582_25180 [Pseudomonadota bacterium]